MVIKIYPFPILNLIKFTLGIFLVLLFCTFDFPKGGIPIPRFDVFIPTAKIGSIIILIELVVLHFSWGLLLFDRSKDAIIIKEYLLFLKTSERAIPYNEVIIKISPKYETAYFHNIQIAQPEVSRTHQLVLSQEMSPEEFCIYRSTNFKKLIKRVQKIEEFFGRSIRLIDERPQRDPKIVKSENVVSTCVIIGFSLIFIGGNGLLVFFNKWLLAFVISGVVVIAFGFIYGKFNIPFSR